MISAFHDTWAEQEEAKAKNETGVICEGGKKILGIGREGKMIWEGHIIRRVKADADFDRSILCTLSNIRKLRLDLSGLWT